VIQVYAVRLQLIRCMTLVAVLVIVHLLRYRLVDVDLANHLIKTRVNVSVQMGMNAQVQLFGIWRLVPANVLRIHQLHLIVALWVKY